LKKQELDQRREEALRRYRIIAPLVGRNLAESEKRNIRWLIRSRRHVEPDFSEVCWPPLRREGLTRCYPVKRKDKGFGKAISPEVLLMAAELRRELPARSAERIRSSWREKVIASPARHWNGHLRQAGAERTEIKVEQKQSSAAA